MVNKKQAIKRSPIWLPSWKCVVHEFYLHLETKRKISSDPIKIPLLVRLLSIPRRKISKCQTPTPGTERIVYQGNKL